MPQDANNQLLSTIPRMGQHVTVKIGDPIDVADIVAAYHAAAAERTAARARNGGVSGASPPDLPVTILSRDDEMMPARVNYTGVAVPAYKERPLLIKPSDHATLNETEQVCVVSCRVILGGVHEHAHRVRVAVVVCCTLLYGGDALSRVTLTVTPYGVAVGWVVMSSCVVAEPWGACVRCPDGGPVTGDRGEVSFGGVPGHHRRCAQSGVRAGEGGAATAQGAGLGPLRRGHAVTACHTLQATCSKLSREYSTMVTRVRAARLHVGHAVEHDRPVTGSTQRTHATPAGAVNLSGSSIPSTKSLSDTAVAGPPQSSPHVRVKIQRDTQHTRRPYQRRTLQPGGPRQPTCSSARGCRACSRRLQSWS